MTEDEGLRVQVLKCRYGVGCVGSLLVGDGRGHNIVSVWWKNISLLGKIGSSVDLARESFRRKVGCGDKTNFWEDVWVGEKCFKELLPRLFNIFSQRNMYINKLG